MINAEAWHELWKGVDDASEISDRWAAIFLAGNSRVLGRDPREYVMAKANPRVIELLPLAARSVLRIEDWADYALIDEDPQ